MNVTNGDENALITEENVEIVCVASGFASEILNEACHLASLTKSVEASSSSEKIDCGVNTQLSIKEQTNHSKDSNCFISSNLQGQGINQRGRGCGLGVGRAIPLPTSDTSVPEPGVTKSSSTSQLSTDNFANLHENSIAAVTTDSHDEANSGDNVTKRLSPLTPGAPPKFEAVSLSASALSQTTQTIVESPKQTTKSNNLAPDLIHHVKWIAWHGVKTPIITQNENGPCPLLAIINVLLLRGQVRLEDGVEIVTTQSLLERLGDCILRLIPKEMAQRPDYQQNVSDSLQILPKLSTGLDVNVRFTGVSEFEYTPECIVFDLLNISLYHGWLIDPASQEDGVCSALANLSYNQMVERIIDCKSSGDSSKLSEALAAEQFLEMSASQLTNYGLSVLIYAMKEGDLAVFFRNNHFSTLLKHVGSLLLLVTDQGFLNEHEVVWETLEDVGGNSRFLDANFKVVPPKPNPDHSTKPIEPFLVTDKQMENDFLVAMSLSQEEQSISDEKSDLHFALKLQEEENRRCTKSGSSQQVQQRQYQQSSQHVINQEDEAHLAETQARKKDRCTIM